MKKKKKEKRNSLRFLGRGGGGKYLPNTPPPPLASPHLLLFLPSLPFPPHSPPSWCRRRHAWRLVEPCFSGVNLVSGSAWLLHTGVWAAVSAEVVFTACQCRHVSKTRGPSFREVSLQLGSSVAHFLTITPSCVWLKAQDSTSQMFGTGCTFAHRKSHPLTTCFIDHS